MVNMSVTHPNVLRVNAGTFPVEPEVRRILTADQAEIIKAELPENRYYIFGKDGGKELAEKLELPLLAQIPLVMSIREGGDKGLPAAWDEDSVTGMAFNNLATEVIVQLEHRNIFFKPTEKVKVSKK